MLNKMKSRLLSGKNKKTKITTTFIRVIFLLICVIGVNNLCYAQWNQLGLDIDGEAANDKSGRSSLSADGLTVAIGAALNDGGGTDAGHVRVYSLISGVWTQQGADIDG